jgi:cysteine sulfinate desulfinase/cysteine desulfurase-like protein
LPPKYRLHSGGTGANNLAILGVTRAVTAARNHVVACAIEHPVVLFAAKAERSRRRTC